MKKPSRKWNSYCDMASRQQLHEGKKSYARVNGSIKIAWIEACVKRITMAMMTFQKWNLKQCKKLKYVRLIFVNHSRYIKQTRETQNCKDHLCWPCKNHRRHHKLCFIAKTTESNYFISNLSFQGTQIRWQAKQNKKNNKGKQNCRGKWELWLLKWKTAISHDNPCQLKRPHELEQKALNYKKTHGFKIFLKNCKDRGTTIQKNTKTKTNFIIELVFFI